MTFPARLERFRAVDSTQRVVREWLDQGTDEVAVAVAGYQTAGRGRQGREWLAPQDKALLLSVGFRPGQLAAQHAWRLAAVASLAMRDAAEEVAGLKDGTLWLKWPNDIVAESPRARGGLVKVAGVLGESALIDGAWNRPSWASASTAIGGRPTFRGPSPGHDQPARAGRTPADRQRPAARCLPGSPRTALRSAAGRPVRRRRLVDEPGDHDAPRRHIPPGETIGGIATGIDPESGALLLSGDDGHDRSIDSGEVIRCRVA